MLCGVRCAKCCVGCVVQNVVWVCYVKCGVDCVVQNVVWDVLCDIHKMQRKCAWNVVSDECIKCVAKCVKMLCYMCVRCIMKYSAKFCAE